MSNARVRPKRAQIAGAIEGSLAPPATQAIGLILAGVVGLLVLAFAIWYSSSGLFPAFPNIQNDYVDLGTAFLHGQLSLLEQPDPRLADLGNPYEYTQRKGLPYHWDASYYDNRYYLYWGPVPALASAALQAVTGTTPPASLLVLLPFSGLIVVVIALLWILAELFDKAGRVSVCLFILPLFFNLPMLVTIGQPRHYQASILFGQFFLLLGVLGIAQHLRGRRAAWLGLTGLAWGLAIGSRYNLAISVAVYTIFIGIWFWRRGLPSLWRRSTSLLIPLALCLSGLGLYNLARFGNPLETGLTYQFTIPEFRQVSYSISYIPSGLYAYLIYPLTGSSTFPFMQDPHFRPALIPSFVHVPEGREFDQVILGLIPTVPAIWLAALCLPLAVAWLMRRLRGDAGPVPRSPARSYFCYVGRGSCGSVPVPLGILLRRGTLPDRSLRARAHLRGGRDLVRGRGATSPPTIARRSVGSCRDPGLVDRRNWVLRLLWRACAGIVVLRPQDAGESGGILE